MGCAGYLGVLFGWFVCWWMRLVVCLVWLWVLGFPFALDFGWLADCCEFGGVLFTLVVYYFLLVGFG